MKNIDIRAVLSSLIAYIPVLGIVMLAVALPFRYGWVQRTALYMAGIGYLIDFMYNRRFAGWHWTRDKWVYVVMILFFLFTLLRQFFDTTPPTYYFRAQMELRVAFLCIGIVGLMGWNREIDICRYVGYTMLAVSVGIVAYIGILECSGIDIQGWKQGNRFLYNAIAHKYVGAHMRIDFYLNLAIVFGFYLIHKTKSKWQIGLIIAAIIVLVTRLLFSDGRSGMLAMMFIIGSCLLVYLCKYASKPMIIVSVLFLVLLGGIAVYQNERLNYEKIESEPRLEIWNYTLRQIEQHPWWGYGLSSASIQFVQSAYHDENMQHYLNFITHHPDISRIQCKSMAVVNPHNLYLQLMLESGILSPILFVLIFAIGIAYCDKQKRLYMALTAFLILWQAVFDSFSPHFPPLLVCLCLWLMMLPESVAHISTRNTKRISDEDRVNYGNDTATRADSVDR